MLRLPGRVGGQAGDFERILNRIAFLNTVQCFLHMHDCSVQLARYDCRHRFAAHGDRGCHGGRHRRAGSCIARAAKFGPAQRRRAARLFPRSMVKVSADRPQATPGDFAMRAASGRDRTGRNAAGRPPPPTLETAAAGGDAITAAGTPLDPARGRCSQGPGGDEHRFCRCWPSGSPRGGAHGWVPIICWSESCWSCCAGKFCAQHVAQDEERRYLTPEQQAFEQVAPVGAPIDKDRADLADRAAAAGSPGRYRRPRRQRTRPVTPSSKRTGSGAENGAGQRLGRAGGACRCLVEDRPDRNEPLQSLGIAYAAEQLRIPAAPRR